MLTSGDISPAMLEHLSALENAATPPEWRLTSTPEPGDKELPVNVGKVGGEGTTKTLWAWVGHHQKRLNKEQVWYQSKADPELIVALRNNASELISRARRAEELERENAELLRDYQIHRDTLSKMDVENMRLLGAIERCRVEMKHQGMDTSTPVRELHRAGRLENP